MLRRKCLLIGAPGEPTKENFLKGAILDVENYRRFLLSPSGGAWKHNEIIIPDFNPSKKRLISTIKNCNTDFVLIIFTGHGLHSNQNNQTWLKLNEKEFISVNDLVAPTPKQAILIDACRTRSDDQLSGYIGEELIYIPSELSVEQARIYYDKYIAKADNGINIIYSCSIDETSTDYSSLGGACSLSLLCSIKQWITNPGPNSILPINIAFKYSKDYLQRYHSNVDQTPVMRTINTNGQPRTNWFPIALRKTTDLSNYLLY